MGKKKYCFNATKAIKLVKFIVKTALPKKVVVLLRKQVIKDNTTRLYFQNRQILISPKDNSESEFEFVFYWDAKPNFGDLIGPYLISKMTGKPVINIRNKTRSGLMTVGSIIHQIDRKDVVIWGSGLIEKPSARVVEGLRKYNPNILSVRGKETAKYLKELGIAVPDEGSFGDPALVLPLFYTPKKESRIKKIGVVPHFIHKDEFINRTKEKNGLNIINVQDDMESVVDQIACSSVCISTSLHGIIVAQAYKVPWVWLEICDHELKGADFKFTDFFSTIDIEQVAHEKVKLSQIEELDFNKLAEKAFLPEKKYNEKQIINALEKYFNKDLYPANSK